MNDETIKLLKMVERIIAFNNTNLEAVKLVAEDKKVQVLQEIIKGTVNMLNYAKDVIEADIDTDLKALENSFNQGAKK